MKIMRSILENPKNANQICSDLGVNYRTIEHHLKVLLDNHLVMTVGDGYGKTYFPGELAQNNLNMLIEIINKTEGREKVK
ncbi:MAG: winged helix-turn-helix domain-containing protein [Thermoplasmataceae archaeon]